MAEFKEYAPKLMELEGGFVDHPDDRGKATNMGVTIDTYKRYCGEEKTVKDLLNMSYGTWCNIMKDLYWDKCLADKIDNQAVAEITVDWCVNSGLQGLRKVQEIAGVKPDGIAGPKTLAAINDANQQELFDRIKSARTLFYENIVKKNPSQRVFLKGWLNRLKKFKFE